MPRQVLIRRNLALIVGAILGGFSPCVSAAIATSVSVSAMPSPAVYGSPVTISALVAPGDATGKVTFYNGVTVLGIAALSGGSATCFAAGGCSTTASTL
jgi:hypothetical protein